MAEELPEVVVTAEQPNAPALDIRSLPVDVAGLPTWPIEDFTQVFTAPGRDFQQDPIVEGITGQNFRPEFVRMNPETGLPEEICTVVVNGLVYEDWESVWIQWNWTDFFSIFRLTTAEREPYPENWAVLRLTIGDNVEIYLGGLRVIQGTILTRQVAYDAKQHVVQLQGMSWTWFAARSSIEDVKYDYSGMNFLQIAAKVLAPTGVGFKTFGEIDMTPFDRANPDTGEKIGPYLDGLARQRKIIVSNTPAGDFLFVGEHSMNIDAELLEGENIKKMQCIITDDAGYERYRTVAQSRATDSKHGKDASEMQADGSRPFPRYSFLLTPMEVPAWTLAEVVKRNDTEMMWSSDVTKIQATVTVYGWFRPMPSRLPTIRLYNVAAGHTLWMAGDEVTVRSPMAMLNNIALKIQTVTWTQDNQNGTQTTMLLVNPAGLNSKRWAPGVGPYANSKPNPGPAGIWGAPMDPQAGPG